MLLPLACSALLLAAANPGASSTSDVMKALRRIEAASLRGDTDAVRLDTAAQREARPTDVMPRIALAWLTLPSDDAWNQLKAIATLHPENPWAHYGMARIYTTWKMRDQARAEVEPLLKRDASFYPALTVLGDLAFLAEDWTKAEASYRRALAIEDDPLARTGLGLTLLRQGQAAEGRAALQASLRIDPAQPAALAALLPLLEEAKDPALLEVAEAAAEVRPKDRDARRRLADLRAEAGDAAGAAREYERVLALGGRDVSVLERLASLYRTLEAPADEARVLSAAIAAEATRPEPCLRLADLRAAAGDRSGAEAALREALQRAPGLKAARVTLALLEADAGHLFQALEQERAVVQADPSDAEAAGRAAKLEAELKLPKRPLRGNVNGVYWAVSASLQKLFAERRARHPGLAGKISVRVSIGPSGSATAVEVLEDTVGDPVLIGHVYCSLRDAQYQERKVEPVIDFVLGPRP